MQDAAFGLLAHFFHPTRLGLLALDLLHNLAAQLLQDQLALGRVAGVGQQCGNQRGAAGRQRSPGWPDVQRRNMPVAHVLFVDGIDGVLF